METSKWALEQARAGKAVRLPHWGPGVYLFVAGGKYCLHAIDGTYNEADLWVIADEPGSADQWSYYVG